MKVWTNKKFRGHWPVGTSAVVVADSAIEAVAILNIALKEIALPGDARHDDMVLLDMEKPNVLILNDGTY